MSREQQLEDELTVTRNIVRARQAHNVREVYNGWAQLKLLRGRIPVMADVSSRIVAAVAAWRPYDD